MIFHDECFNLFLTYLLFAVWECGKCRVHCLSFISDLLLDGAPALIGKGMRKTGDVQWRVKRDEVERLTTIKIMVHV